MSGENGEILARLSSLTIMPHEFLYIVCNSTNRLDIIEDRHNVIADLKSKPVDIFHWELNERSSTVTETEDMQVSTIHLLGEGAFSNKAPHHLVNDRLDALSEELCIQMAKRKNQRVITDIASLMGTHYDKALEMHNHFE